MGRFFFNDLRTIAIQIVHVSCVFCLCCGSQFEGHFLNEKKLTARCNTSVCGQTMGPKLGPKFGSKFGATWRLQNDAGQCRPWPQFGVHYAAPFWFPLFHFHYAWPQNGVQNMTPILGPIFPPKMRLVFVNTTTTCRHRFEQKWTQKWRPD